ncbi:interleukin-8-like [Colossoma macropomum]|uniref:interleukin-8-like n=1 Tax=Colossoma macropomum TaxID=42526 RepID=UPI001864EC6A|nr:interleukin-8-like [Colossoma macropomum]
MRFLLLLALVTSSLLLTSAMQPLGRGYNSQCMCLQFESRLIPPHSLRSVEIFPKGPHCKNTEVIASLVTGHRICLNTRAAWVKKLIHFIEKNENETKKA